MEFGRKRLCILISRNAVLVSALLLELVPLNAAVKPDAAAARAFAAQLQIDFQTRKSAAFVEHIDTDAFHERVFGTRTYGGGVPLVNWPDGPPALTKSMAGLDAYPYFTQYRIVLENDVRILDCDFFATNGFRSARFFLVQNGPSGEVGIADFQLSGDAMPKSEILRHSYILQGYRLPQLRSEEEEQLDAFSRHHSVAFAQVVAAFARGDIPQSFQFLQSMPPEVAATRICRHYLTCQTGGSREAVAALRKALRDKTAQFDPIYRLTFALDENDRKTALAAVDDVLESQMSPSLYRCIKAGLLIDENRAAEAYALAHDTLMLEPRYGPAYVATVRAAVGLDRRSDALEAMTRWSRFVKSAEIDRILSSLPPLKDFCASPEYSTWKERATSKPAPPALPAPSP